jgi:DNA-binding NtrC family response regulator
MPLVLVIDDEPGIRYTIPTVLQTADVRVITAETASEGLRLVREQSPDLVLLDIRLGSQSGINVFHDLRAIDPQLLIVFMTGHGTTDTAIEAMKMGAFDYLVKPLDLPQLKRVIDQGLHISALMKVPASINPADSPPDTSDRFVGSSPAIQAICKQIGRVAPQDVNVLLLGESGTGKELVARAIYQHSRRERGPFLAINCAAIPETLLESELFGHEKGAFTGADNRRIGKFEQCHRGTIFLDEVGDMPLATQAKILRLLQDGQFQRVGGNSTLTADVRIIAATNQNLEAMIHAGRFRRDLYYRLRGVALTLPPLRERLGDIPELAHYFLARLNRQLGTDIQAIHTDAILRLQEHTWPGNVRELQSVLREAMIVSTGPILLPEFLPLTSDFSEPTDTACSVNVPTASDGEWQSLAAFIADGLKQKQPDLYRRAITRFDRLVLSMTMEHAGGLQSHAAELLGVSRPTLRAKLRQIADAHESNEPLAERCCRTP